MSARRLFRRLCRRLSLLPLIGFLAACSPPPEPVHVTLNAPRSQLTSLVWLAQELDLFRRQGIVLRLQPYPSGKRALAALLRDEGELAVTAETPFVIAAFRHPDLRLFATIGQSDNEVRILARRDHGITIPPDLRGKTIATQRGSAVHFFLGSFLLYHDLPRSAVSIRFLKAEELPDALVAGDIDAFSMRDPFLHRARRRLAPEQVVEFAVPGLYTKTYNLVGDASFTQRRPGVMERLLRALDRAARFADEHPEAAIDKLAPAIGVPRAVTARNWPDIRLAVTLNQGLLTTLQEEALWAVDNGLITPSPRRIPDFLTRLDTGPLSRAVPHALGLIGIEAQ